VTGTECPHGRRVQRSGISKGTGKLYNGLFCPAGGRDCPPVWLPDDDARWREYNSVIEAAKQTCREKVAAARAERDSAIAAALNVAKVIESMAKLDLEARRTRIQERDAALMNTALDNILRRLELTSDQRARVNTIIVEELSAIAAIESGDPARPYTGRGTPAALPRAR
jgi:hypothetical protein